MNEKARKTIWRACWAWNNEKEERWLARMAREGWHLTAPRGIVCRFEKGEPADVVYRMNTLMLLCLALLLILCARLVLA